MWSTFYRRFFRFGLGWKDEDDQKLDGNQGSDDGSDVDADLGDFTSKFLDEDKYRAYSIKVRSEDRKVPLPISKGED